MNTDAVEVWLSDATLGPDTLLGTLHRGTAAAPARFVYYQAWLDSTVGLASVSEKMSRYREGVAASVQFDNQDRKDQDNAR